MPGLGTVATLCAATHRELCDGRGADRAPFGEARAAWRVSNDQLSSFVRNATSIRQLQRGLAEMPPPRRDEAAARKPAHRPQLSHGDESLNHVEAAEHGASTAPSPTLGGGRTRAGQDWQQSSLHLAPCPRPSTERWGHHNGGGITSWIEQWVSNPLFAGSSPAGRAIRSSRRTGVGQACRRDRTQLRSGVAGVHAVHATHDHEVAQPLTSWSAASVCIRVRRVARSKAEWSPILTQSRLGWSLG